MATRFPDLPASMRSLPVDHRGFPVPWFVAWVDGLPQFPVADPQKQVIAWRDQRCWVCGKELRTKKASVIGPMCAVNLTSSEPPSHLECARFSVRNCPFMARPNMRRVPREKHDGVDPAGIMIERNPGVALVWIEHKMPTPIRDGMGGVLFRLGRPVAVEYYAEGRKATREEVMLSLSKGLPALERMAKEDDDPIAALAELGRLTTQALALLPQ